MDGLWLSYEMVGVGSERSESGLCAGEGRGATILSIEL